MPNKVSWVTIKSYCKSGNNIKEGHIVYTSKGVKVVFKRIEDSVVYYAGSLHRGIVSDSWENMYVCPDLGISYHSMRGIKCSPFIEAAQKECLYDIKVNAKSIIMRDCGKDYVMFTFVDTKNDGVYYRTLYGNPAVFMPIIEDYIRHCNLPDKKYYALYDRQTGRYLQTGINSTSKPALAKAYIDYISVEFSSESEEQEYIDLGVDGIINSAMENDFVLEEQLVPFEEETF